ncbi:LytTR family transcriptional regulator DNA-binding domain-containing protein [Lentibacillus sp.]|uniref:LytTR family transcriptional regulator DNA-binding domain-containing protein n=1 Tax=Lentibacillus sp. TaxID=1925746 RepID=UPI002B4AC2A7|nr:LytTR family transcriptional regulator DNA-binding domain-containing protein [Lentibacillus sp.]HLS08081.1 LytTR family transcriptional regulator DNA-binding domain-containing protein [Lentibacillus sp.]
MAHFKIDHEIINGESLPSFSLTIDDSYATSVYSDTDMQAELAKVLRGNARVPVFDQQEGLYERLTVQSNIAFYHKWFGCKTPLPEILVLFELHSCAKKPLYKCSKSEIRRVYFAKYYMSGVHPMVFREPIHGVDIKTINTFINMLQEIKEDGIPALVLVSNMEHALLLGDAAYKLQEKGLQPIEVDDGEEAPEAESTGSPMTTNLFKIPAKVDDKMILFDPPEIDYIESQDGKAMIVINGESYAMDSTLAEIEKKLEIYGFYRCHRSYIVNLQKVREIITWSKNTYSLRIDNKIQSTIPLSRTKIQDIQENFSLK